MSQTIQDNHKLLCFRNTLRLTICSRSVLNLYIFYYFFSENNKEGISPNTNLTGFLLYYYLHET